MLISKQDLLKRDNWNEEKINSFLGKELHLAEGDGYILSKVMRTEKSKIFHEFKTGDDLKQIKENIEKITIENTETAIARFSNNIPIVTENSILNNLEKYKNKETGNLEKEIFHWIKKENINLEETYDLFTDGSLKIDGGKNIIGCAGWLKNQNGDVILEFVKNIDSNNINSSYDFEIYGLEMGMKIVESLGIKKLNVYSDSISEMRGLTFIQNGFIIDRMTDIPEIYFPIRSHIEKIDVKFSYIPRDYNSHADSLSKVYCNEYKDVLKNILEEQKKKGYDANIDSPQYYTNSKIENLPELKKEGILFVQRYLEKRLYQFSIDMSNKEILSVNVLPLKETRKKLFEEKMIFKDDSSGLDSVQLALLTKEINESYERGNKTINVTSPSLGIKCRIDNIIMVTNDWKENYLNLDKAINKMEKVTFLPLTNELLKLTKNWMDDYVRTNHLKLTTKM